MATSARHPDGRGPSKPPPANVRSKLPKTLSFYALEGTVDGNGNEVDFYFLNRAQDALLNAIIDGLKAFGPGRARMVIAVDGKSQHIEELARHGVAESLIQIIPPKDLA